MLISQGCETMVRNQAVKQSQWLAYIVPKFLICTN